MKPEDLDRLYHLEQENKRINIRPLAMDEVAKNITKKGEKERFMAGLQPHLFLPDTESSVDYRSIHSARINGN